MVLCFQIFFYMFSLKMIYHVFFLNFWKWFVNFIFRIIGYDGLDALDFHEKRLLKSLPNSVKAEHVPIGQGSLEIWTVSLQSKHSSSVPIVLLHGLGYGASFWSLSINELSKSRTVHAIDMLGFGRSSRSSFSYRLAAIETEFVESLEAWRIKMGLEKFILLGHGFGGYVAFLYASRFPAQVRHVVFIEPWGFDVDPKIYKKFLSFHPPTFPLTAMTKFAASLITYFNHFSLLRFVGPGWGTDLIKWLRGDLLAKFSKASNGSSTAEYLYHWNAIRPPTGETAFHRLALLSGYARHPLLFRINSLARTVPMTFVTGSRSSYVCHDVGNQVKQLRSGSYVDVQVINGAGHYVFVEKSDLFNQLVSFVCIGVDIGLDKNDATDGSKSRRKRYDSLPPMLSSPEPVTPATSSYDPTISRRQQHQNSVYFSGE